MLRHWNDIQYIYIVIPVYKGHSRKPENVAFMSMLKLYALLFNGKMGLPFIDNALLHRGALSGRFECIYIFNIAFYSPWWMLSKLCLSLRCIDRLNRFQVPCLCFLLQMILQLFDFRWVWLSCLNLFPF